MTDKQVEVTKGEPVKPKRGAWGSLGLMVALMLAVLVFGGIAGKGELVAIIGVAFLVGLLVCAPFIAVAALVRKVREEDPAEFTAKGKPYPKWKLWLRRTTRPTPFWRKHMDEQLSDDFGVQPDADSSFWDLGEPLVDTLLFISFAGIFVALLAQFVIGPIFLSPGFWEFGPAYPVAKFLADICLLTGQCNFGYLVGGLALGVILLAAIVGALLLPLSVGGTVSAKARDALAAERMENLSADFAEAVGVLDKRLVHLRADLVLAGLLPLSLEEREEAADAALEAGPPLERIANAH